ncbi:MAG: tRNA glutamyl-Q(34) synthetase GluQRS [Candidatus Azotimanducaceae bacterium]
MNRADGDCSPAYIGRFAPSPSGPLHFGSLVAALASFLDAKSLDGQWLVRIEDLDPPRAMPGADQLIVSQLTAHGLIPDQPIVYQSQRLSQYAAALEQLDQNGHLYPCRCARRDYRIHYPGTCRTQNLSPEPGATALRFRIDPSKFTLFDRLHGKLTWQYGESMSDFIVRRKDGLHAYQLAVVIDDIDQKISHIVRGADLLHAAPLQEALFAVFDKPSPTLLHIPVVLGNDGRKLSKQAQALPLDERNPARNIRRALDFLNQQQPPGSSLDSLLDYACKHWRPERIPKLMGRSETVGHRFSAHEPQLLVEPKTPQAQ